MSDAIVIDRLRQLGGRGTSKEREWRTRVRLNWHHKATSIVRHLLRGDRKVTLQEAKEIEAAYLRWCAEQLEANREEKRKLFDAMRQSLDTMEASDPEFYRPHIDAVRELMLSRG